MEALGSLIDLFLNLDEHLRTAAAQYGPWIYAVLFAVIFAETGLVFTPFLPGDSLLFAAGALAAFSDGLNIWVLLAVLVAAAIIGDFVNYSIGHRWGAWMLQSGKFKRVIKDEYIAQTDAFFERHGGKTITIARFFPFIRTFAPFVAGMCGMDRKRFLAFNILGGVVWVVGFLSLGYFFGTVPFVKKNFEVLVLGIIAFSVVPAVYHAIVNRRKAAQAKATCPGQAD